MSGFFEITEQDLNDGKANFNAGDRAEFMIASIVKKVIKEQPKIIFECVVLSGPQAGMKYSEFFSVGSSGGKKALGVFLKTFMTAKEASQLQDPNVLINKKFTAEFYDKDGRVNMRNTREINDTPQGLAQPAVNAVGTAPTAQTAAIAPEQSVPTGLSKSIF